MQKSEVEEVGKEELSVREMVRLMTTWGMVVMVIVCVARATSQVTGIRGRDKPTVVRWTL